MTPCITGSSSRTTVAFCFAPRTDVTQCHFNGVRVAREARRGRVKLKGRDRLAYALCGGLNEVNNP